MTMKSVSMYKTKLKLKSCLCITILFSKYYPALFQRVYPLYTSHGVSKRLDAVLVIKLRRIRLQVGYNIILKTLRKKPFARL